MPTHTVTVTSSLRLLPSNAIRSRSNISNLHPTQKKPTLQSTSAPHRPVILRPLRRLPSTETYGPKDLHGVILSVDLTPALTNSDTLLPPCHPEALTETTIVGDVWAEGPLRCHARSSKQTPTLTN